VNYNMMNWRQEINLDRVITTTGSIPTRTFDDGYIKYWEQIVPIIKETIDPLNFVLDYDALERITGISLHPKKVENSYLELFL
jgi:hypothetical protein